MVERPSPAQLREDGRDGVRPGLDGPDGVLAVASPEAALLLLLTDQGGSAAAAADVIDVAAAAALSGHWLGLEHDGAFGFVDEAQFAEPKVHGISATKRKKS